MHTAGDAASVVLNGDAAVRQERDVDGGAGARHGLVDGIVHNLVNQMMQTALRRRTDVHTGTLSDGLETLKDLNLVFVIYGFFDFFRHIVILSFSVF